MAYEVSVRETHVCIKNISFGLEFAVVMFQKNKIFISFANFQNLVFDIDGVIASLSITFKGRFTIHFNCNSEEKKKGVKLFSGINGLKLMA